MLNEWDHRFLDLAEHVAQWSKDPSTKVGAVIVDQRRVVLSLGYNGFPRGVEDLEHRLQTREVKYALTVHAEANAVLNALQPLHGASCFCTHSPCSSCAAILIQSGVKKVVAPQPEKAFMDRWADSLKLSSDMFKEAGVELVWKPKPMRRIFTNVQDWRQS